MKIWVLLSTPAPRPPPLAPKTMTRSPPLPASLMPVPNGTKLNKIVPIDC